MELFELISMFFPVLMIALFIFISVRKSIKKKKSAGDPAEKKPAESPKKMKQISSSQVHSELRPWLERFPDMVRTKSGPVTEQAETELPVTHPVKTVQPTSSESLNVLNSPGDYAVGSYSSNASESETKENRPRLSKLPELKKAVIWAEILGKPKGLE